MEHDYKGCNYSSLLDNEFNRLSNICEIQIFKKYDKELMEKFKELIKSKSSTQVIQFKDMLYTILNNETLLRLKDYLGK